MMFNAENVKRKKGNEDFNPETTMNPELKAKTRNRRFPATQRPAAQYFTAAKFT